MYYDELYISKQTSFFVFVFFGKLQHYKQTQHDDMTGLCVDSTLNLLRTAQRGFGRMNGVIGLSLLQTSTLLTASSIPYVMWNHLEIVSKLTQNTRLKLTSSRPCSDQTNAARQFLERKQTKLWVCLWDPDIIFTGAVIIHSSAAHHMFLTNVVPFQRITNKVYSR